MTDPITPPDELVQQWSDIKPMEDAVVQNWVKIATAAAQWGADQELEACCEWVRGWYGSGCGELINGLRAARRPKPPSEADQALEALNQMDEPLGVVTASRASIIRRALERLKELEAAHD